MLSRVGTINIFLACVFIFFGVKTYGVWKKDGVATFESQMIEKNSPPSQMQKKTIGRRLPSASSYNVVTERNLFSPDRTPPMQETSKPEPEIETLKIPGKKIVLYGVIMMEDYATALVSNPEMKPGERQTMWVEAGDDLGALKVVAIEKESLLLTDGGKEYKVLLYDKAKPVRPSVVSKTETPTVITTEQKPKKSIKTDSDKSQKAEHKELSNGEYEIVKTPFGEIKRRIK